MKAFGYIFKKDLTHSLPQGYFGLTFLNVEDTTNRSSKEVIADLDVCLVA